jgi:hypothetical protein
MSDLQELQQRLTALEAEKFATSRHAAQLQADRRIALARLRTLEDQLCGLNRTIAARKAALKLVEDAQGSPCAVWYQQPLDERHRVRPITGFARQRISLRPVANGPERYLTAGGYPEWGLPETWGRLDVHACLVVWRDWCNARRLEKAADLGDPL